MEVVKQSHTYRRYKPERRWTTKPQQLQYECEVWWNIIQNPHEGNHHASDCEKIKCKRRLVPVSLLNILEVKAWAEAAAAAAHHYCDPQYQREHMELFQPERECR